VVYKRPSTPSWSRFSTQGASGWWAGSTGTRLLLSTVYGRSGLQETQYTIVESVLGAGGLRLVGGQQRYMPSLLHGVLPEWSTRDPVHHRGVGSRRRGAQVGGRAAAVHAFSSPRCTVGVVYKRPSTPSWSRFSAQGGSGWWAGSSGTCLLLSTVYCRSGLQETRYIVESVLGAGGLRLVGGQQRYMPSSLHGVLSEWSTRDPVRRGVGGRLLLLFGQKIPSGYSSSTCRNTRPRPGGCFLSNFFQVVFHLGQDNLLSESMPVRVNFSLEYR